MRCAIYARFSTDKQSASSAEDQVAACTARAEREGWEVVGVYTDLAMSGTNNKRPGMTAMLADAQAGSFDIVTAEAIDRIARNQADIATIYQQLEFAGVAIDTLSEGRVNELHIGLKGTMSALFLKDLADKIRRGQRGTVQRGRVPGGLTYGYDVVHRLDGRGEPDRGLRQINLEQAVVVRRIYDQYAAGISPKAIAKGLNADGIPSPRGGEWRASSISGSRARQLGVIHNPVYVGRYVYNRVRMVRDPESRRRISRVNSADDKLTVEMPELRIVSDEQWQAVQSEADKRMLGPIGRQVRPKYLLTGLVRCGRCGGSVATIGDGRLGCTRHREAGTCDAGGTIKRGEIESRVLGGIADRLLMPDAVSRLVKRYHEEMTSREGDREKQVTAVKKRLARVDKGTERLVAAIADGAADFREIREALAARRSERDGLLRELEEVRAMPAIALNPHVVNEYRKRVRNLALSLTSTTAPGQEVLARLRDLIEGVTLTPLNDGAWDIQVTTSLGAVVALAGGKDHRRRRAMLGSVGSGGPYWSGAPLSVSHPRIEVPYRLLAVA